MNLPDANVNPERQTGARGVTRRLGHILLAGFAVFVVGWMFWVYSQIMSYASHDEARPADAIAVFGAAEYEGRPSPVLRARLDQALALYQRHLAPMIITLGGGGDQRHSEGAVGHDYLLAHGVPETQIIAETQSRNTEESAQRLAKIASENHLVRVIAVSDGTHLFRIHELCRADGLDVYTSPRPEQFPLGWWSSTKRIWHEMLGYTLWRLHVH